MKDIMKLFNDYAKTFDLKNKNIMMKFHHSYRVMEYSRDIAKSLNLNEDDIKLASIIGLLHDIARFYQWTKYETYVDLKSIDHGDLGYTILKDNFLDKIDLKEEDKKILLLAVKMHNKYKIDVSNEREELFCNIIRDADKLDIMKEQINVLDKEYELKDEVIDELMKHQLLSNKIANTPMIGLLRHLAFTFDLNYDYSFKFILENEIIEKIINIVEIYSNRDLKKLQDDVLNYIKGEIVC